MIFMSFLAFFLIRSIVRPLRSLMNATNRIAGGDLNHEISVRTDDELEMLGNAMERMRQELSEFYKGLEDLVEKRTRQLRQSQKLEALGKMAGGTAHEFNNILAIMLGAMELVIQKLPDGSKAKQQLEQAYTTGERGRELVKEILIFSRSSQTEVVPHKLDKILENAAKAIQPTLPHGMAIHTHIQPSTCYVSGKALQIEQIIINLCNNAAHAMIKEKGMFDIRLDEVDSSALGIRYSEFTASTYVRILISDNGSGIPPDIQNHIFDPFFTTKEVGKGTGLGLSVVHGIVLQYGGKISVKSELGKGTTFEIIFPAVRKRSGATVPKVEQTKKMNSEDKAFV
jgi:signal transduction histidine kinase